MSKIGSSVQDEAFPDMDISNLLTRGWISLSLYKVMVDYFCPTPFNIHNGTIFSPQNNFRFPQLCLCTQETALLE